MFGHLVQTLCRGPAGGARRGVLHPRRLVAGAQHAGAVRRGLDELETHLVGRLVEQAQAGAELELAHTGLSRVADTTYLCELFRLSANGTSLP
jgi:hypothetical protein